MLRSVRDNIAKCSRGADEMTKPRGSASLLSSATVAAVVVLVMGLVLLLLGSGVAVVVVVAMAVG